MSVQATPPEQLATLLESPNHQRVDVLALVVNVERDRPATTADCKKKIVDITIRDLSGQEGASEGEESEDSLSSAGKEYVRDMMAQHEELGEDEAESEDDAVSYLGKAGEASSDEGEDDQQVEH